ncbi:MAG: N-acetylmuramoyl-L-alanine amidase [Candidatus Omnitrophica bacterium]|nr:N-acetylmuramoyl-L-alanine amidase [Candidatus Omnitrophota bacterium]
MKFLISLILLPALAVGCARVPARPPVAPLGGPVSPAPPPALYHAVERGQTFYRIAKMYGVDVGELMRVNHREDPGALEVGERLLIPGLASSPLYPPAAPLLPEMDRREIRRRVGPKREGSVWKTITVHHSATRQGSAKLFDRDHTRRHMGGLFYHFVLGNGTTTDDGEVEVGWRWKRQVKANRPYDIQICLVGDFNKQQVSDAQFGSLVTLISLLMEQYPISLKAVRRHEDIKGRHTECPGRHFPFYRLLSELKRQQDLADTHAG